MVLESTKLLQYELCPIACSNRLNDALRRIPPEPGLPRAESPSATTNAPARPCPSQAPLPKSPPWAECEGLS
jgi:hypothetical protein